MKRKFTAQFSLPENPTEGELALFKQLKDVSDDLKVGLDNGLTFAENFKAAVKTQVINSDTEIDLGNVRNGKAKGAFVLHTDGAVASTFKSRYGANGNILVTLTVSPSPANITFIIVGE